MKNFAAKLALLSALSLCGSGAALAETPPAGVRKENLVARVDSVQVPTSVFDKYFSGAKLKGELSGILSSDSRVRVLTSNEVLFQVGKPCLVHLGTKYAISYFDPRSSQFQVQYVDIGSKLDVHCKSETAGGYTVDVNPETSTFVKSRGLTTGTGANYPETSVLRSQVRLSGIQLHQSWLIGTISNTEAKSWLAASGISSSESQSLVYILTMEKP